MDALAREWAAEEERRKAARAAGQGRVEFHKSGGALLLYACLSFEADWEVVSWDGGLGDARLLVPAGLAC